MTKLVWNKDGERFFEAGVDRGVFYPTSELGIPWNGLSAVTAASDGDSTIPYYLDGIKFLDIPSPEDFSGTIEALSHPKAFSAYDGFASVGNLLLIGQQPRKSFGFSYRTRVGNDTVGDAYGYKIHLVYNALVGPNERAYSSLSDSLDPVKFRWDFTTTPIPITGYKPSAHLVAESTNLGFISALEDILYGTETTNPEFPTPEEVLALLATF